MSEARASVHSSPRPTSRGESQPIPSSERLPRYQRVLTLLRPEDGAGLEIGPLYDPIVLRGEADVRYVDVHPGNLLREHYAAHPGAPVDDIVDPDFYLIGPEGIWTLAEAVQDAAPFDWVVASHVIEHVPDVIGWLDEIAQVLVDGGRLVLAIPDRRFCFDAIRSPTTVGDMLLAHGSSDKIPSIRAVYDHHSRVVDLDLAAAWAGKPADAGARIHPLSHVLDQVRLAEGGQYIDCHVWLFTPATFVEQLLELEMLDLTSFVIEEMVPPAHYEQEFYVRLSRLSRGFSPGDRATARQRGIRSWVDHELDGLPIAEIDEYGVGPLSDQELRFIAAKRRILLRARRLLGR